MDSRRTVCKWRWVLPQAEAVGSGGVPLLLERQQDMFDAILLLENYRVGCDGRGGDGAGGVF